MTSLDRQNASLLEALERCQTIMAQDSPAKDGLYCQAVWDTVLCWPMTPAGTLSKQSCPDYLMGFNPQGYALKRCMSTGEWFIHPEYNTSYTDFSGCLTSVPFILQSHMKKIQLMYNIGYGVSLAALILAITIICLCRSSIFRRYHSKISSIHLNLFVALAIKAIVSLMKESLMVEDVGLPSDVFYNQYGNLVFREDVSHWECRFLITLFTYMVGTVYMWILVEGLFLHNIIYNTFSTDRSGVHYYVLLGWAAPLAYLIPWIFIHIFVENHGCWNMFIQKNFHWLLHGFLIFIIAVNFLLLVIIIRALYSRLVMVQQPLAQKYRKLAKFTMILVPMFGAHYVVFAVLPDSDALLVPKLYGEMFCNSFQGFFVSIFFCFLNEENFLLVIRNDPDNAAYWADDGPISAQHRASKLRYQIRTSIRQKLSRKRFLLRVDNHGSNFVPLKSYRSHGHSSLVNGQRGRQSQGAQAQNWAHPHSQQSDAEQGKGGACECVINCCVEPRPASSSDGVGKENRTRRQCAVDKDDNLCNSIGNGDAIRVRSSDDVRANSDHIADDSSKNRVRSIDDANKNCAHSVDDVNRHHGHSGVDVNRNCGHNVDDANRNHGHSLDDVNRNCGHSIDDANKCRAHSSDDVSKPNSILPNIYQNKNCEHVSFANSFGKQNVKLVYGDGTVTSELCDLHSSTV